MKFHVIDLFFPLLTVLSAASFQALALEIRLPYRDGKSVCQDLVKAQDNGEIGKWIQVPIKYSASDDQPEMRYNEIYTWTERPFDPHLPSVIFFAGGPGANSHGGNLFAQKMNGLNVIFFDQRGVVCSRPSDPQLLIQGSYYSSELTAQDAQVIANSYGLSHWTAYGHSYGTVPATIAGHLFPDSVDQVVLEGVIYRGDQDLWVAPHRRKLIQKFFSELPEEKRKLILELSALTDQVPSTWFGEIARYFMYSANFNKDLGSYLDYILGFTREEQIAMLNAFRRTLPGSVSTDNELSGPFAFVHLTCQEMSGIKATADWSLRFEGEKLVPDFDGKMSELCLSLGLLGQSEYDSRKFPIANKVIYINGTTDGATEAPNAVKHFKQTAKGSAQLLLIENSGHFPVKDLINAGFSEKSLTRLFSGSSLSSSDLNPWNQSSEVKVRMTQK